MVSTGRSNMGSTGTRSAGLAGGAKGAGGGSLDAKSQIVNLDHLKDTLPPLRARTHNISIRPAMHSHICSNKWLTEIVGNPQCSDFYFLRGR